MVPRSFPLLGSRPPIDLIGFVASMSADPYCWRSQTSISPVVNGPDWHLQQFGYFPHRREGLSDSTLAAKATAERRTSRLRQMNGIEGMRPAEFGHSGTELRRDLVAAVLEGKKTASASLREEYEPYTNEALPQVGEGFVVVDIDERPVAVIETTEVHTVAAGRITLQFARDEGEGFESVADWRAAHESFWSGIEITDDTLVVAERFRLVKLL